MSDFYKIMKADVLPGEPFTPNVPNAKPIQSYWCQVEGQEKAVMIGKQVREDGAPALLPGQNVYGDLLYAKSQKGNEYWKFKSQKVPEGVTRPAETPAQAQAQAAVGASVNVSATMPDWFMPVANQIDYIFREMRKLDDTQPYQEPVKQADIPVTEQDEAPLAVSGEPLSVETSAMLDDIFGKKEEAAPLEEPFES